jgi:alkanesulfonate monooxygenase SsuD/methylene tetrahydromethanopterin reductase-like flavin-dependent oxidoreductase (luciferase family)
MNVGVYFDLRNPREWATDASRLYGFTLEMCEEAERLGCHSIWLSEHHRFDDGYLPQPLTLAAAVAARTRTPRIGTAIVIAPLHHPVELAEQAAIVDLISGGRLDLGLGAGYRVPEFELYGANLASRYTDTDDRARELRRLWSEGIVTPGPAQERLPIWMGYQGPKGARRAGQLGEGLLSIDPALVGPYRDGLADGGHDLAEARMASGIQGWATEDPEADWPIVARHLAHQVDSYRRHMVEGTDQPTPRPVDPDRLRQRDLGGPLSYFLYGTPEDVAARLRAYVGDAPVEAVFFWASVSGMPEDMVARHVNTICTRVAPLLAKKDHDPAVA